MNKILLKLSLVFSTVVGLPLLAEAQLCSPIYYDGCSWGDDIVQVTVNGQTTNIINNNSEGCSPIGYSNLIGTYSCNTYTGGTYSGSISTSYDCCQYVRGWIDYNSNGIFESSEIIFTSGEYSSAEPFTFSFTVPEGTSPGNKVLRIRNVYGEDNIDPCMDYEFGETHDYLVQVIYHCWNPINVLIETPTPTTATITWDNVNTFIDNRIEYGPAGFVAGTGTVVTSATSPITITDLDPYTNYDILLQQQCDATNFSTSTRYHFMTPCQIPTITSTLSDSVCISGAVVLSATGSTGTTNIYWYEDVTLMTSIHTGDSYITPEISTNMTYYVVAESNGCLSEAASVEAVVLPEPILTVEPAYIELCEGDTARINTISDGHTDNTFAWGTGATTDYLDVVEAGLYTVVITDQFGCTNIEYSEVIQIDTTSVEGFDFYPSIFTDYKTIHFEPINEDAVETYLWNFGDGNTSSERNPIHTYADSGNYTVTLIVSNVCNSDTVNLEVYVLPKNTSIEDELFNNNFTIYPNPNSGSDITIEMNNLSNELIESISIINVLGQEVKQLTLEPTSQYKMNIQDLNKGYYFIKVRSTQQKIGVQKILLQ